MKGSIAITAMLLLLNMPFAYFSTNALKPFSFVATIICAFVLGALIERL